MKTPLQSTLASLLFLTWLSGIAHAQNTPLTYLKTTMDQYHKTFNVYTDSNSAGNHFAARGQMSSPDDEDTIPAMDETWTSLPHSGCSCIRATFKANGSNWGGWYFMNGVLDSDETAPSANWGDYANAGVNLQGASQVTFWAKGAKGGERVQFIALGVGWDSETDHAITANPDSSPQVSSWITLSKQWKKYSLDLSESDLTYVLGGFGWVTNSAQNRNRNITFYLDDIQYNKRTLGKPRFLQSYTTICSSNDFDLLSKNVGFTYDNAVALLAFLSSKDLARAKLLADALVYAQQHDRYFKDGRIRNAYQAGDIASPPGWESFGRVGSVRMPGWSDPQSGQWMEDEFQVSTHTGNMAWAMLALIRYYEIAGGNKYLVSAQKMGEWIETHCRDTRGAGGYTGGYGGWEPSPTKLFYKATEHNIDLYAVFSRLYKITKQAKWANRANYAKKFVLSMWNGSYFWTGTGDDGVTVTQEPIPQDVQSWSLLALKGKGKPYWSALEYVEDHHRVGGGYDFNEDADGIWFEGTGQMAVAYAYTGNNEEWRRIVNFLQSRVAPSGGLIAANLNELTTGLYLTTGEPWLYYRRQHVGATGWMIFALRKFNPF